MLRDIPRYTQLLVVSDTGMYQKDRKTYAFGPVVKELQEMLSLFETITWIGFDRPDQCNNASYVEVPSEKIKVIALERVGGTSMGAKLKIIASYPKMKALIASEIDKHQYIHCRAPSNPAFICMKLSKNHPKKQFWFKYAGNWTEKAPFFYDFQRKKLKTLLSNCKVTVNGSWPNQESHIFAFENPCLEDRDRDSGMEIVRNKKLEEKYHYCFVGGLNENKGIRKMLGAFSEIKSDKVGSIHIVGDGELKEEMMAISKGVKKDIVFHGFLGKRELFEVYRQCHFIILPSQSEGFPKVIGEAMNFGCAPIVSQISCIDQYIRHKQNGFLLKPVHQEKLKKMIEESLKIDGITFRSFIDHNYRMAHKFTYGYYIQRIEEELFKSQ